VLSIKHIKSTKKKLFETLTNKKTKQLKARQEEAGSRRPKAAREEEQSDEILPSRN
jgi:hypothetical protein